MRANSGKIQLVIVTLFLLLSIGFICQNSEQGHNNIILNEVCCYNDSVVYDTIGNYYDYIEIYNPTAEEKNIGGFYLSDDKDDLKKYVFPEQTMVGSGEYILLWAGQWTEAVLVEDSRYYIMDFSIRAGETLYLSDAQGEIVDTVKIPDEIERNAAYSRVSVSNDIWRTTAASPKEENDTKRLEEQTYLDAVVEFSAAAGFYEEPFYLEMTTDKGYDIYYTLDGSTPTTESIKYEEPVYIEDISDQENRYAGINDISLREDIEVYIPQEPVLKTNVIRAIAVNEKGETGKESYATYFVDYEEKAGFDKTATISLVTDPENLFGYETGIYIPGKIWDINKEAAMEQLPDWQLTAPVNYFCKDNGWQKETIMQYFSVDGELIYDQIIGMRTHGRTSVTFNQKSFNIFALPEVDGNEYVCEGMFGNKESTLMLRNGGGDCHWSKLRDVFLQELVADRSVMTSDYEPCQVFLDGEYWGLYMLQERVTECTFTNKYGVAEDNLIIAKNESVITEPETDYALWEEVIAYAAKHDLSVEEHYRQMEQWIDIQSCIDHYAIEVYVANCDSLKNNYARWRTKEVSDAPYEDGRWRWVIFDMDDSSGAKNGFTSAEVDTFVRGTYWYTVLDDPLFEPLIKNEEFKERFVVSFMDMANYNFDTDKVSARLDELAAQLGEATIASQKRFFSPDYNLQYYTMQVEEIKTFFKERYAYITAYMKEDLGLSGELVPVQIQNTAGGKVKLNTLTLEEAEQFEGKYYSDYAITLQAEPADGYRFAGWNINGETFEQETVSLILEQESVIIPMWEVTKETKDET